MYRIGDLELAFLKQAIDSGKLFRVGGQQVEAFEHELRQLTGAQYALLLSGGGTAALASSLIGLDIGPGDEVIVPAYTFMATAAAVLMVGAIPVIAEIDDSLALDPADAERRVSSHTKAIIPVHMIGRPADLDAVTAVARRHGLKVVEDACQMDGGSYKGRRVGSIGDVGAFSFIDFKILSCGEGGALITNDRTIYERASMYHDSGTAFRPYAENFSMPIFLGQQFRASEIMGAILRGQLQRLDGILQDARGHAARMRAELDGWKGLKLAPDNDADGDCGINLVFNFASAEAAISFAQAPGVEGVRPIDTGKHVFINWEPLLTRNIMHHPRMNPYNFPENQGLNMDYSEANCPRTLEVCARSVFVKVSPDWDEAAVTGKIQACKDAV